MNLQKNAFKLLCPVVLVALLANSSCTEVEPSPLDVAKTRMTSGVWKIKAVIVDGVDGTSMYTGMTLLFSGETYTATNGGVIWPTSGTWSFNSDDGESVLRNDDLELIVQITDTTMDISLFWPEATLGGGRINSLHGNHVFSFTK